VIGFARTSGLAVGALALAAPAYAAAPYFTDDAEPTALHHSETYIFVADAWGRGGHAGAYGVDVSYGAGPDLQLSATLPVNYEQPRGGRAASGVGAIELAAKVRLLRQEKFGWNVSVFPRVFIPSGAALSNDRVAVLAPVWISRSDEGGSTFGGGGCALNRGGDAEDYCIAGLGGTRRVLPRLTVGGEVFHQTADSKDAKASTVLGAGAVYDVTDHVHVLGYAARVRNGASGDRGAAYAAVLFTF